MPNITMLGIEDLRRSELKPYIDRALELRAPDPGFFAMMGHNTALAEKVFLSWVSAFSTGSLDHKLKEIIRVLLSRMARCSY